MGRSRAGARDRLIAVADPDDRMAAVLQAKGQQFGDIGVVLDNQNVRHRSLTRLLGCYVWLLRRYALSILARPCVVYAVYQLLLTPASATWVQFRIKLSLELMACNLLNRSPACLFPHRTRMIYVLGCNTTVRHDTVYSD